MVNKATLLELDPDTRAFALVGAFMGHFALLELGIDSAIGEVLDLKGAKRAIAVRNMSFDAKIKTLRSLVHLFVSDAAMSKSFDKVAKRARVFGETRNIIAHTPFRRSQRSDGVEFFVIKASSKLDMPEMDWSVDQFLLQIEEMLDTDRALRSIENRASYERIARALLKPPNHLPPLSALGGLFGLGSDLLARDAEEKS